MKRNKERKSVRYYFPDTGEQIITEGKISYLVSRNGRVKIRVEEVDEDEKTKR